MMRFWCCAICLLAVFSRADAQGEAAGEDPWSLAFSDSGTGEWTDDWFLEGDKATVRNSGEGMLFSAGPLSGKDASHAVLWTKRSFQGDIKLVYDYTRIDSMTKAASVNIVYLQATGLGTRESPEDIRLSSDRRRVPQMKSYFQNMNLLHVSYAASGPERTRYISARRYPVGKTGGFGASVIEPVYEDVDLFKPGETYRITVTKEGSRLTFAAVRDGVRHAFVWNTAGFPAVTGGRIGFRHMWERSSRYRNIKVFVKNQARGN